MSWTAPGQLINSRAIADNLLAYFAANQAEALLWAHGSAIKPFAEISNSRSNLAVPVYPSIAFSDDNDAVNYQETVADASYSVVFGVTIQNAVAATAVLQARSYAKAIAAMIKTCPKATLTANTGANANSTVLVGMEIGFEPMKAGNDGKALNDFGQLFEVRATFLLAG